MSITVQTILDQQKAKQNGTYPVKIRILYDSGKKAKYIPIRINDKRLAMTEPEWVELNTEGTGKAKRKIIDAIKDQEAKVRLTIKKITGDGERPFNKAAFDDTFDPASKKTDGFFQIFDDYLDSILTEGRIGSYRSYKCARVAFYKFVKKEIDPAHITPVILRKFESHLLSLDATRNTIAIYMRTIRLIYNIATEQKKSLLDIYPFARRRNERDKYVIRTGSGKKGDALTRDQLSAFNNVQVERLSGLWEAKLLWMFCLYCQGMNMKDVALLKPSNIVLGTDASTGYIAYVRHKTKRTEKNESEILVPITDNILSILRDLDCNLTDPTKYVFPILNDTMPLKEMEKRIQQKTKTTNKRLEKLCQMAGIPKMTTYWSRHTYSTLLKFSGVDVQLIKEALGHSRIETTQHYLKRWDLEKLKTANRALEV